MDEVFRSPLSAWESFYVIVGSSGAALTGLQFVVIALVAESRMRSSGQSLAAFGTPTIVHFCVVLLTAAILSAPWHGLSSAAVALGVVGLVGLAYAAIVVRRARAQTDYAPVLEDWLWHAAFPVVAYGAMLLAAIALPSHPRPSLFVVGAVSLLLLFIGIHNAWDTVTYIAVTRRVTPETPVTEAVAPTTPASPASPASPAAAANG